MLLPFQIGKTLKGIQTENMKCSDARMKILGQIVDAMKAVKYFAWEEQFLERITAARDAETVHIGKFRSRQSSVTQIGRTVPPLCTFAALLVYSLTSDSFNATDVFATLAIFQV